MTNVSQSPHTPFWNSRNGIPQPVNAPGISTPIVPAAMFIWKTRKNTPAISRAYSSRLTAFLLANRPPSQLSRNPAARLSTVGSIARKRAPVSSRMMNSTPPAPPNHSHAAPAGSIRKAQKARFSTYSAVSLASITAKALTGMDSSKSPSRPPKTTP